MRAKICKIFPVSRSIVGNIHEECRWKGRFTLVDVLQRIWHFPFGVHLTLTKSNNSKRYVLGVMTVFLLGGISACPQVNPHDGPTVTLGIGINLPSGGAWPVAVGADHAVFYIPAVGNGEILGVLVLPKGRFVGIRVIPSVQGHTVKILLSALLADKSSGHLSTRKTRGV
jgi:hypothetical protein